MEWFKIKSPYFYLVVDPAFVGPFACNIRSTEQHSSTVDNTVAVVARKSFGSVSYQEEPFAAYEQTRTVGTLYVFLVFD